MTMTGATLIRLLVASMAAGLMAQAVPVGAQSYSTGYQFLKAVKDKDGDEAMALLDAPGSTVVNSRDLSTGQTGLHIAVDRRDLTWIAFLTRRGANPNIRDKAGATPLMLASQLGFVEGVQALVQAGARIDDANDAGETPLISAVHSRNLAMLRVLLEAGADPDRNDNSGRSARDYAELRGAGNPVLATIRRSDEERAGRAAEAQTYGPSL